MNIFISYRRSDTRHLTGRIYDRLRTVPGIGKIFYDIDVIGFGEDFRHRIRDALAQRPVCIVVIGEGWAGLRDTPGSARIFDGDDAVRMEVSSMLASGLHILPILADGATMPSVNQVPQDVQGIMGLNAMSARHKDFERDMAVLLTALGLRTAPFPASVFRGAVQRGILFCLLSAILLVFAAAALNAVERRPLSALVGGDGLVWLLILGVLLSASVIGFMTGAKAKRQPPMRSKLQ